jgi:hypothetical protein
MLITTLIVQSTRRNIIITSASQLRFAAPLRNRHAIIIINLL